MRKLTLKLLGRDSWSRPVYENTENGRLYVDVDPRESHSPALCTKQDNAFDGEPNIPLATETEVEFVPCRDTWGF